MILLDALVPLLLFMIPFLTVIFIHKQTTAIQERKQQKLLGSAKWEVTCRGIDTGGIAVEIVKAGQTPQRVALIKPDNDDFERLLAEAKLEADSRVAMLNQVSTR